MNKNTAYCVAALYRFVALNDYIALRTPLQAKLKQLHICGTLLLAAEGINGTVAGREVDIDTLLNWLVTADCWQNHLIGIEVKKSWTDKRPFTRSKVKLKKEIVTMGIENIDPNKSVGTYIEPADWNQLISNPDVITIDTRNNYEVQIGCFKDAINPQTRTFREFPGYAQRELDPIKNKKVAMYCTGGIRCEKSTAYMKSLGFDEVYHLKGGILKYLEEIPREESLWEGECFVFDERVAVNHDLQPGRYIQCHACRMPLTADDCKNELYTQGESCHYCHDTTTPEQKQHYRERQKQVLLAKERGEEHRGDAAAETLQQRKAAKQALKEAQRKN
ncbi:MAG: rhodanese-related sulfurtransferase [Gammaproteobacteria bacterium]|nr:rhodanese-related sulfurtransferase [Gammaproteobacteria bacterium]MCP4090765.1 rhodanese-related sulfurtransferase [Gammaproteobacteria bacterium]MCP4277192.1 rhodanese-related sulfurtransferase [Gammaproteobacteria bacterium]MCP4832814.1 rhodanese-related sulfurtransferase [Gammaproteobacteria bacterium]MCP4927998.1 rhodanese-related sulfurtransferase [Gammaproteobacteria bacterium]